MYVCERERKKREREVVVILLEWRRKKNGEKKMGRGEYYRVLIYF